jgi:hypothetical protein
LKTIATIIQFLILMVLSNLTCQFSKKPEKMAYNFNEYVDMLLCLGASNDNASEAARDYARLYPQRRHPDAKVIRRLMQRLRENGQNNASLCKSWKAS